MSILSDDNFLTEEKDTIKIAFGRQLKEQNKKLTDQKVSTIFFIYGQHSVPPK